MCATDLRGVLKSFPARGYKFYTLEMSYLAYSINYYL